jgi:ABC-type amino acid transport substrate-binding protein
MVVVTMALAVLASVGLGGPSPLPAQTSALDQVTKRGALRVGWANWYPYMYPDPEKRQLSGVTVDIFNEMAREMKVKVEFVEDSWATLVAGLQAGKFDVTMPLAVTPARAQVVTYTRPITKINVGLVTLAKNVAEYPNWQALDKPGKKIVTTLGSSIVLVVEGNLRQAQLLQVKANPESISHVLTGRADAWATALDSYRFIRKERPELAVVPGPPMGSQQVAFAVRQGEAPLQAWIDRFVADQRKNGNLLRIIRKHGFEEIDLAD